MSWVLFLIVLTISFIVVRIGAIAFQITGLEWSLAKFQALSCFTGTGFTTKEAELITGSPQRRRIASVLMVLGNAGLVIMIATFASSLDPASRLKTGLQKRILPFEIPDEAVPWINLAIIAIAVYMLYKLFTHPKLSDRLTHYLRKRVIRREAFKRVTFEELLIATGGYGVSKVMLTGDSPILGKTLVESQLRRYDVTVLAVTRAGQTTPNPPADMRFAPGDELVCFGRFENIRSRVMMNP